MDPKSVIPGGSLADPRSWPLWVATFFLCSLPRQGAHFQFWADQAPQLTHYIRQLMVSLSNFRLHAFYFHVFLKKVIPARAGDTFLKIDPHHFASKITTFWTPNWSLKSQFSYLCSSLPLLCSFGLVFFSLLEPTWGQLGSNLGQLGPTWGQLRLPWANFA